jgi:transposase
MTQGTGRDFTDEFRREAVRLTQTSGRTIKQVVDDLGVGLSTLTRWKRKYCEVDLLSGPQDDVEKELDRLRKENELLRQERDLLKKRRLSSPGKQADKVPAHRREESGSAG